jgi:putative intracellular protease/amidase
MATDVATDSRSLPAGDLPEPVVVLAYDGVAADEGRLLVDLLDRAGIAVTIASVESSTVTSYHGQLVPSRTVHGLGPCRALIVPGGMGVRQAATDERLLGAIRELAGRVTWLAATSTGSVLLAAAGVVAGARATTHWLAGDLITRHGLRLVDRPFVEHGRLLTASGVASTETLGLRLVGALAGARAESELLASFRPRPPGDTRYQRPAPFWRTVGRRRVTRLEHPLDPTGRAEVVLLDLTDP